MSNDKKNSQLGMNYSTASNRLVKDLLFKFISETTACLCYHCFKPLTREDFSIEHKIPWLDSEEPLEFFFDLENISFSHLSCNVAAARRPVKISEEEALERKRAYNRKYMKSVYSTEQRQKKYTETGY